MPAPGHIALVAGLVSSSYFTFGNIGLAFCGIMPAIARGQTTLPVADRVVLWEFFYEAGKLHMLGASVMSAVALSVSAYLSSAGPLRNVAAAGAVAAYTSIAFTLLFLLPVNNDLIAMLKANAVKSMGPKEEHALDQLDKWRALHRVRIVLGLISWLASATALLATDAIIKPSISLKTNH
ncbi:hypothetical protein GGX14DRAFT_697380 [Mycena pura]|uniref:DUF1772-domain-containing protein n=1 Tax=Mycena pura TaxID=153505 RepID=A0AAD6VFC2_9AGAR|nr:hypothetical protein GGX14DRAFT_697380 [Mycena pura]